MGTTISNHYSDEFKKDVVAKAIKYGNNRKAAKENGVHVNTVGKWKKEYSDTATSITTVIKPEEKTEENIKLKETNILTHSEHHPKNQLLQSQNEIAQLKNIIKKLELELKNHQQQIGEMVMEKEKLKGKFANCEINY